MRWVVFLLALLAVVGGSGAHTVVGEAEARVGSTHGSGAASSSATGGPAFAAFDRLDQAAFLPAGAPLLPMGWSPGEGSGAGPSFRAFRPPPGASIPTGFSPDPPARAWRRSAAHRGLAAHHALDRAGRRAFRLGTPPPLRSV